MTANWSTWSDRMDNVTLNAGNNTIKYQFDSGDNGKVNIDYLFIEAIDNGVTEAISSNETAENQEMFVFENSKNQLVIISDKTIEKEGLVTIFNTMGQKLVAIHTTGKTTVINKSFSPGVYIITVNAAGSRKTKKIIIN